MRLTLLQSAALATLISFTPSINARTSLLASVLCKSGEFWHPDQAVCLPTGGPAVVDEDKSDDCPEGWYWHSTKPACVPRYANTPRPVCTQGKWYDPAKWICKIRCESPLEFWFTERNQCIPKGGPAGQLPAPLGKRCPTNWYWDSKWKSCLPTSLNSSTDPACDAGWVWSRQTLSCEPNNVVPRPQASKLVARNLYHRRLKGQSQDFCPKHHQACPISGLMAEMECIDVMSTLDSCGGCASIGEGQDCTSIPFAKAVSCSRGRCIVHTCKDNLLKPSQDKLSCIPV